MKTPKKKIPKKKKPTKVWGIKKSLDEREIRFAEELLSGKSTIKAAESAGYTWQTANAKAYKWVGDSRETSSKPLLFDYIEAKRKKILAKYDLTRDKLAVELGKIIFTSVKDLYKESGQLKNISEMTDAEANLIAGFDVDEVSVSKNITTVTKKVKVIKKTEAIAIASKLMGFNAPDKHQHDIGPSFLEFLMKASAGKAADNAGGA